MQQNYPRKRGLGLKRRPSTNKTTQRRVKDAPSRKNFMDEESHLNESPAMSESSQTSREMAEIEQKMREIEDGYQSKQSERLKMANIPENADVRRMDFSTILEKESKSRSHLRSSPSEYRQHDDLPRKKYSKCSSYARLMNDDIFNTKQNSITEASHRKAAEFMSLKSDLDLLKTPNQRAKTRMREFLRGGGRLVGSLDDQIIHETSEVYLEKSRSRYESSISGRKSQSKDMRFPRVTPKKLPRRDQLSSSKSRLSSINRGNNAEPKTQKGMIQNLKKELKVEKNKFSKLKNKLNLNIVELKKLEKVNRSLTSKIEAYKKKEMEGQESHSEKDKLIENLQSKLSFFQAIEEQIGNQPDLREFLECNLGINKKLDLKLRKSNDNFLKISKKYKDARQEIQKVKTENEALKTRIEMLNALKESTDHQNRDRSVRKPRLSAGVSRPSSKHDSKLGLSRARNRTRNSVRQQRKSRKSLNVNKTPEKRKPRRSEKGVPKNGKRSGQNSKRGSIKPSKDRQSKRKSGALMLSKEVIDLRKKVEEMTSKNNKFQERISNLLRRNSDLQSSNKELISKVDKLTVQLTESEMGQSGDGAEHMGYLNDKVHGYKGKASSRSALRAFDDDKENQVFNGNRPPLGTLKNKHSAPRPQRKVFGNRRPTGPPNYGRSSALDMEANGRVFQAKEPTCDTQKEVELMGKDIDYIQLEKLYNKLAKKHHELVKKLKKAKAKKNLRDLSEMNLSSFMGSSSKKGLSSGGKGYFERSSLINESSVNIEFEKSSPTKHPYPELSPFKRLPERSQLPHRNQLDPRSRESTSNQQSQEFIFCTPNHSKSRIH